MPEYVKNSMVEDLVVNGKVPIVTLFKGDTLRNYILSSDLKIMRTGNYGLFLFILRYTSKILPQIKHIIPYNTLTRLYRVEREVLSYNLFEKLGVFAAYIVKRR
jgi:hypothetical protein